MPAKRIRRDNEREIGLMFGIAICVVMAALVIAKTSFGPVRWAIVVTDVVVAGLCVYWWRTMSGLVECPSCGATLREVALRRNPAILCLHCGHYATGDGPTVDVTPPDHVATSPVFGCELPKDIVWPDGCCACGRPATRTVEARLVERRKVASVVVVQVVRVRTTVVQAPHCADHADGVELTHASDWAVGDVALAFRSYAYFRRFSAANQARPRSL